MIVGQGIKLLWIFFYPFPIHLRVIQIYPHFKVVQKYYFALSP